MRNVYVDEAIAAVRNANAEEPIASAMFTSPFSPRPRIRQASRVNGCAADGVLDGIGAGSTRHRFSSARRRGLRHRARGGLRSTWRHNVFEPNAVPYRYAVRYRKMCTTFSENRVDQIHCASSLLLVTKTRFAQCSTFVIGLGTDFGIRLMRSNDVGVARRPEPKPVRIFWTVLGIHDNPTLPASNFETSRLYGPGELGADAAYRRYFAVNFVVIQEIEQGAESRHQKPPGYWRFIANRAYQITHRLRSDLDMRPCLPPRRFGRVDINLDFIARNCKKHVILSVRFV